MQTLGRRIRARQKEVQHMVHVQRRQTDCRKNSQPEQSILAECLGRKRPDQNHRQQELHGVIKNICSAEGQRPPLD